MKILIDNGHGRETAGKRSPDGDADQEAAFYILKHTACASCLTENGFMRSESPEFLNAVFVITKSHIL